MKRLISVIYDFMVYELGDLKNKILKRIEYTIRRNTTIECSLDVGKTSMIINFLHWEICD